MADKSERYVAAVEANRKLMEENGEKPTIFTVAGTWGNPYRSNTPSDLYADMPGPWDADREAYRKMLQGHWQDTQPERRVTVKCLLMFGPGHGCSMDLVDPQREVLWVEPGELFAERYPTTNTRQPYHRYTRIEQFSSEVGEDCAVYAHEGCCDKTWEDTAEQARLDTHLAKQGYKPPRPKRGDIW